MISKAYSPVTLGKKTKSRITRVGFLLALLCLSVSCSEAPPNQTSSTDPIPVNLASPAVDISNGSLTLQPDKQTSLKAYFGDLHVHTAYSLNTLALGTLATLSDAYRYAKGEKKDILVGLIYNCVGLSTFMR